jgi:raffinose/stachyose/melibiose transport system substrate-binding protein
VRAKRSAIAAALFVALGVSACGGSSSSGPTAAKPTGSDSGGTAAAGTSASGKRTNLQLWFWGSSPAQQQTMKRVLVDGFNASQSKYSLSVTFNPNVDKNIQVALAANKGPDVVYGSGPAFSSAYAAGGKLANMDPWSKKYGWKERILAPIYQAGTVDGKLYSLPNSLSTLGIFYNKEVLQKLGVQPPKTLAEVEAIMDKAQKAGMYASVTGNKGWRPVNENYTSLFLTHVAGPQTMYEVLSGKEPWTTPAVVDAIQKSADWYKKGYLGGKNYTSLNFLQSMQLLAAGKSPFFFGPSLAFQFATDFFNEKRGNADNLGFIPFPSANPDIPYPTWTLGTTASLSINANSAHKDGAAAVIDYMMTDKFLKAMTPDWPGYWGVPLKNFDVEPSEFTGLSAAYITAIKNMVGAVNQGHFGYFSATFFPPSTEEKMFDIDTVWNGKASAQSLAAQAEKTFKADQAKKLVPPIPAPVATG